ncbi:hypothetical protein ACJDT4_12500 [Clostridium neuense]|uniref:DUF2634 domain-containing protein n=1 Tax=Clostridium neuense TaxID=1728934 RepID=A0ABW8TFP9_9CLOT
MQYDIFLSDLELNTIVQLPILPKELPEVETEFNNEEFETYNNGYFNFQGNKKLATFTLKSFFPEYSGKYSFERSESTFYDLLDALSIAVDSKAPVRVVFGKSSGDVIMDAKFMVEKFTYNVDNVGDYQYNIEFKQYREVNTNVL